MGGDRRRVDDMTYMLSLPPVKEPFDVDGKVSVVWVNWVNQTNAVLNTVVQAGTTANRPTIKFIGQQYYDTTLDIPIFVNAAGTAWVDATGSTV